MSFNRISAVVISLTLACAMTARAQQSQTDEYSPVREGASPGVWHLMRYAGVLQASAGQPRPSVAGVTFSFYEEQEGGAALWIETQNVLLDGQGHYSALLGGTRTEGLSAELFRSGKARWLGIQVDGQPEEVRVPLGSVPYAVQAGDAQTLGGRSAADYALSEQIQEVRDGLQAAGFDISGGDPAGSGFQKQGIPVASGPPLDPGSNANPRAITNEDLDKKLDKILAILNEPEPVFSFVLCTEPAIQWGQGAAFKIELTGKGEGRIGAEGFGNGVMARVQGETKGEVGAELKFGWDILKFGVCVDLGAAVRNASPASSSGGATPLRQASLTANDGIAAANGGGLLNHIATLDQDAMLAQMLGLANELGVNPANLQFAFDRVANLSFDNEGGPFAALQLKDEDREALLATLPIPVGVRPVVEDPAGFIRGQVQSLLADLTQPRGICDIPPPAGLEPFLHMVCSQPADPFGPMLTSINTSVNTVKSNVNTVKNKVEDLWCKAFPWLSACQ